MKTRKKRAARFHSQSEAPQAPTGNQEEAQEKAFSPHSASDPGHPALHKYENKEVESDSDITQKLSLVAIIPHSSFCVGVIHIRYI